VERTQFGPIDRVNLCLDVGFMNLIGVVAGGRRHSLAVFIWPN
jgi:hypothetical protein